MVKQELMKQQGWDEELEEVMLLNFQLMTKGSLIVPPESWRCPWTVVLTWCVCVDQTIYSLLHWYFVELIYCQTEAPGSFLLQLLNVWLEMSETLELIFSSQDPS